VSFWALLKSAKDTYFSWTAIKGHFKFGAPNMKYSGYEAGRLARAKALRRKVTKAQSKVSALLSSHDDRGLERARARVRRAEANLDEYLASEAARKAQARKRA